MKNLKKLAAATVLMCVLGLTTFAGEPCTPGEILTPPCAASQAPTPDDTGAPSADAPGQIETPTVAGDEASLTEFAASVLLSIVSLF